MGAVADRIGARRLLLVGAVAFSATSLLAAYAQSAGELIAARALLGIGGATLMPSTMSMIRTLFHDEKQRGRAIGIWTGVMTAGVGLGPVLSGVLLAHFWWGSVFLVNLPAMALLLVVGPVLLPRSERGAAGRSTCSARCSRSAAVLPTIYGIKEWAAHGPSWRWVAFILVGLALGAVFLRRQLRHPHAMIDADLLRNRVFTTAVGTNAISTFALVGNAVFMTAYLQLVLGYSPLRAALWSLVPTVGVGLSAPFASGLAAPVRCPRVAAGGHAGRRGRVRRADPGRHRLAGAGPGRCRRPRVRPGRHDDRRLRAGARRGEARPGGVRRRGLRGRHRARRRARHRGPGQHRHRGLPRVRRRPPARGRRARPRRRLARRARLRTSGADGCWPSRATPTSTACTWRPWRGRRCWSSPPSACCSVDRPTATEHRENDYFDVHGDQHHPHRAPGRRRQAGRDPGQPRLRHVLHRPHVHRRVDAGRGLARGADHAVRPADASTRPRRSCTTRRRSSRG